MIDRKFYRRLPIRERKITLCGSTRFPEAFQFWNTNLTLAGNVVYSVALSAHGEPSEGRPDAEEKRVLDQVHLKKILNSDSIFVLDVNGYIGESTSREIKFARENGRDVYFLSEVCPDWSISCSCDADSLSEMKSPY